VGALPLPPRFIKPNFAIIIRKTKLSRQIMSIAAKYPRLDVELAKYPNPEKELKVNAARVPKISAQNLLRSLHHPML
jgi:hypothetical protein